jgi:hypothetical protein
MNTKTANVWQIIARGNKSSLACLSGTSMLMPHLFEINHIAVIGATANNRRPERMPVSKFGKLREENAGKRMHGTADETGSERAMERSFAGRVLLGCRYKDVTHIMGRWSYGSESAPVCPTSSVTR